MSANIAKIAKVTRILLANFELKTPVTNIAEIARITKVTRKEEAKKSLEISANVGKVTRIFLAN